MAFTVDQLQLTATRKTQLENALKNTGETDPLGRCINEAVTDITRFTLGYTIDQASLDSWTRAIALFKAFSVASTGVPKDIQTAYEDAMKELTAIAEGKRPNLPKVEVPAQSVTAGGWGSETKIGGRAT